MLALLWRFTAHLLACMIGFALLRHSDHEHIAFHQTKDQGSREFIFKGIISYSNLPSCNASFIKTYPNPHKSLIEPRFCLLLVPNHFIYNTCYTHTFPSPLLPVTRLPNCLWKPPNLISPLIHENLRENSRNIAFRDIALSLKLIGQLLLMIIQQSLIWNNNQRHSQPHSI